MHDPKQDRQDIDEARSRYNARKTESSLIAWICSPEWTDPQMSTPHVDSESTFLRNQPERGCKIRAGAIWIGTESTWGEIQASECHCCPGLDPMGIRRAIGEINRKPWGEVLAEREPDAF